MTPLDIIDLSMNSTKQKYPHYDMESFLLEYVRGNISIDSFTRDNGARQKMRHVKIDEIISEVLKQAIKICALYDYYIKEGNKEFADKIPYIDSCLEFRDSYHKYVNFVAYVKSDRELLDSLIKSFAALRYGENKRFISVLSKVSIGNISDKIDSQCIQTSAYKNVVIHKDTINKCKEDVLAGRQIEKPHAEYSLGDDLFAVSDVGVVRKNQEDSVLILTHPQNSDFKIILVSDGMGGVNAGEYASQFVITSIIAWFENLPVEYYEKEEELQELFSNEVVNIHNNLVEIWLSKYDKKIPGATLTGGIIGKNKTVIANVGDSRTYILKDDRLQQLTRDDSVVQTLYEMGEIKRKDQMRFHPMSSTITNCIGCSSDYPPSPRMQIIDNDSYDVLMSFSDGICDCLSDEQIQIISRTTPRRDLAKKLVEAAKTTVSYDEEMNRNISAGKDNETVAMYAPRR